ncbi:hypothetical protein IEQ34_002696 [Dendrobium chrysotoxum]|uniref:Di19 zinc-binding domain-containing protein n=1 Tax=Dendrobium chrysotoxum TaxID=161865 RepID=A0AAV7HJE1_DENCH|nr:hypothetical protein IEQ34_002696 [Dendrobium chrysotoxum]
MDSDSWISRLAAAKRHYLNQRQQNSQSDRLDFDEYEVEEEVRPDFPCPYCYEDHDIASLCSHLEDEHPFESKVAILAVLADFLQQTAKSAAVCSPILGRFLLFLLISCSKQQNLLLFALRSWVGLPHLFCKGCKRHAESYYIATRAPLQDILSNSFYLPIIAENGI